MKRSVSKDAMFRQTERKEGKMREQREIVVVNQLLFCIEHDGIHEYEENSKKTANIIIIDLACM